MALLLSAFMIFELPGCYSTRSISKSEIQYANRTYYFIHGRNTSYRISSVNISNGILSGFIDYSATVTKNRSIHIYVAPDSAIVKSNEAVSVPFSSIAKVEVDKIDGGKSLLMGLGVGYTALFVVGLIAILTKGASCPFVYSDNGSNVSFEGEIYSGATAIPLERNDYLNLKSLKPLDNLYKIKLTNEVHEIQNTNLAELVVFDHPAGTNILADKYGIAHSVSDIIKPLIAANNYGRSLVNEFSFQDSLRYISEIKNDALLEDTISLMFEKPVNAVSSKLIVSGKNTMWLDYMFGRFADLFGKRYDTWKEKRNEKPAEELVKWQIDQGMPLAVYLETDAGWQFVNYYNLPGPMADKKDILLLDLSGVSGSKVNLKLVSGVLFWDLDYVGMDFSADQAFSKTVIPVSSAIDENNKDVASLLRNDDSEYLIQPDGNNVTSITFKALPALQNMNRTFILHTKGNYEILRDARGKPDVNYLRSFLEPGAFIKFSKDHILNYYLKSN